MSDLATQILLQIQEEQVKNARMMGGIAADLKTLVDSHSETKKDLEKRVGSLEKKDWKQAGFLGAIVLMGEPALHFLVKKLGWF